VAIARPFAGPVGRPAGPGWWAAPPLLAAVPAVLLHTLVATRGLGAPATAGEAVAVASAFDAAPVLARPMRRSAASSQRRRAYSHRRVTACCSRAAVAVCVAGSSPFALLLHAQVDAGAVAALWPVVGGALGTAAGLRGAPAAAGAALGLAAAVMTAPLAAAGVLALAAHAAARGVPVPGAGRFGHGAVAVVAGSVSVAVAVLAVTWTSTMTTGDAIGVPLLATTVVLGTGVLAAAWWRGPTPVATAAAVRLACASWPGPAQFTALLLALPALALVAGGLVAPAPAHPRSRCGRGGRGAGVHGHIGRGEMAVRGAVRRAVRRAVGRRQPPRPLPPTPNPRPPR